MLPKLVHQLVSSWVRPKVGREEWGILPPASVPWVAAPAVAASPPWLHFSLLCRFYYPCPHVYSSLRPTMASCCCYSWLPNCSLVDFSDLLAPGKQLPCIKSSLFYILRVVSVFLFGPWLIQGLIYKCHPRGRFRPQYWQALFSALTIFINNLDDDVVSAYANHTCKWQNQNLKISQWDKSNRKECNKKKIWSPALGSKNQAWNGEIVTTAHESFRFLDWHRNAAIVYQKIKKPQGVLVALIL